MSVVKRNEKLQFEDALDKTGFGLYNFMIVCIAGLNNIAFTCMAFAATVIVPASACDLGTTSSQQGVMVAAPFIGNVCGTLFWGYLADTKGRRKMLIVSLIIASIVNALGTLSVNWIMLMAFQFLTLVLASGQIATTMTLVSESIPKKWRNMVLLLVTSIYFMGQGVISVLGIPILPLTFSLYISGLGIYWTPWRTLMLLYSVPSVVAVFCLLLVKESPKFVLAKGDEDGALQILRVIHKMNNGKSKELDVHGLLFEEDDTGEKTSVKDKLVPLFKKPLIKPTLVMASLFILFQLGGVFMQWLPTIANLFFQTLQAGEAAGLNLCGMISAGLGSPEEDNVLPCAIDELALLVVLVVCIIQAGLNAILSVVVNYAGRRNTAMGIAGICGVCGIIVNLIPNAIGSAVFFMVFLMNILVLGMYIAMALAAFPTQVRAVALSLLMTGGQIVSFMSIQVINYLLTNNCELGFYLFASLFTLSAGILLLMPDDRLVSNHTENEEKSVGEQLES